MEISPIPSMPPQQPPPIGSAEQNLLELTKDMMNQIEKLKEALSKERQDPNLIKDPDHLNEVADTVIELDKVSSQGQGINP